MSDGPIGVRGVRWTVDDPSIALPSPTALAATWDPALARRVGRSLAQEARRKGVHVLLAPTVNLHRSPLGGRHFEAYSEDPYLTGEIGTGFVLGVQEGGVGTTVKHFVANDAETDRFTVNNMVGEQALRELYLAPFETIVKNARPWGIMSAYNSVNGVTMSEHHALQNEVLRREWGFDGCIVSDWIAARSTVGAITGGLDVAMPGPDTVYGERLAAAVREGLVDESVVDDAVRNVLRLAARVGILEGAPPAVATEELPSAIDGTMLAREMARRSFVLLRNETGVEGAALPLDATTLNRVALIGEAGRDTRIQGGGSAQVFPAQVISPLEGLRARLPEGVQLSYAAGAEVSDELSTAQAGFTLHATCRDAAGRVLGEVDVPDGAIDWTETDLPQTATWDAVHSVELRGTFTPGESGVHHFGTRGLGGFTLVVDGQTLFAGVQGPGSAADPFEAFVSAPVDRGQIALEEATPVEVSLGHVVFKPEENGFRSVSFVLAHRGPRRDGDELIAEAVESARSSDVAVVVVATSERVESEGFDRTSLRLPGRQDELVGAVASVNPRTIVVVNSGSPVEMPWRNDVSAVLLCWFPGQEVGNGLAEVLLGGAEPGGRLPTTWPARLEDLPVSRVVPEDGVLPYDEGLFIGYRAWERAGVEPAYAFGHGLGYTEWSYEGAAYEEGEGPVLGTIHVRLRNVGPRTGREVVQVYLAAPNDACGVGRPARVLAGFASARVAAGETADVRIPLSRRAAQIWDESTHDWRTVPGTYTAVVSRSAADRRLVVPVDVTA